MFRIEEVRENNRAGLFISSFAAHIAAMALVLIMVLGPSTASARRPPTPENFRVTARTAYTVTLLGTQLPPTRAILTITSGALTMSVPPSFFRRPPPATPLPPSILGTPTPSASTPRTPPAKALPKSPLTAFASRTTRARRRPPLSSASTKSETNYADLSWIPAQDDGPHLSTQIYLNGVFYYGVGRGITNATLRFLQPGTTYSLTARAVDFGNNVGPFSDPIALVTLPANPNDTTPPTTPANLYASGTGDGSTETHISWTQSTDDFDAQSNIRYDVYVNGVWSDVLFGSGGESIVYAEFGQNLIEVTATDTAGNTSAPATFTIFF